MSLHPFKTVLSFTVLGLALTGCGKEGPEDGVAHGDELFANYCAPCHGDQGHGRQELGAPAIAGLPDYYVERQLYNYRNGVRGNHIDDAEGLRMRPMSMTLANDADIARVVDYVSKLPSMDQSATLAGDAEKGKALYAPCGACHGPEGKGNPAMNAPPIAQQHDWYLVTQLDKFKSGVRGANPDDTTGATMAPMAAGLADEQAMKDVVAYIKTL